MSKIHYLTKFSNKEINLVIKFIPIRSVNCAVSVIFRISHACIVYDSCPFMYPLGKGRNVLELIEKKLSICFEIKQAFVCMLRVHPIDKHIELAFCVHFNFFSQFL